MDVCNCLVFWCNARIFGKTDCESSGIEVLHHFPDFRKMIDLAKGAQREIEEV